MNYNDLSTAELIAKLEERGRVTGRDIYNIIYSDRDFLRSKPVLKPSEQYEAKNNKNNSRDFTISEFLTMIERKKNERKDMIAIVGLMAESGCRVSEILRINHSDISVAGHVKIRGLKGSSNRIIYSSIALQYLLECKKLQTNPFMYINRLDVYRWCKNNGFYAYIEGNNKVAVTHSFRHLYIQSLQQIDAELETVSKHVGHKSIKTTEHYAKSTKKRGKRE